MGIFFTMGLFRHGTRQKQDIIHFIFGTVFVIPFQTNI